MNPKIFPPCRLIRVFYRVFYHESTSASFALLFVQNYAILDLGDKISSGVWWIPKCCFFTALKSDNAHMYNLSSEVHHIIDDFLGRPRPTTPTHRDSVQFHTHHHPLSIFWADSSILAYTPLHQTTFPVL